MQRIATVDAQGAPVLDGISDALRLQDGRIIVANCGANEVHVYDAAGRLQRRFGRRGRGPGDFEYLRRLFPAGGDTIAAYDGFPNYRINLIGADGTLRRIVTIHDRSDVIGRLADGSFVGRSTIVTQRAMPGVMRRPVVFRRIDAEGKSLDSIAVPGIEMLVGVNGRASPLRLGRTTVAAVALGRLIVGGQDEAAFTDFANGLQTPRRIETITKPVSVSEETRQRWNQTRDSLVPSGGTIPAYSDEFASAMPAYRDIVAGTDGNIWVQDPVRAGQYPLVWTMYTDGRATARTLLPRRFFPTEFGPDWVLGVFFDADGPEEVHAYKLVRSGDGLAIPRVTAREAQPPDRPKCGAWASR